MSCNQHWDCRACREERESSADKMNARVDALQARLAMADRMLAECRSAVEWVGNDSVLDEAEAHLALLHRIDTFLTPPAPQGDTKGAPDA